MLYFGLIDKRMKRSDNEKPVKPLLGLSFAKVLWIANELLLQKEPEFFPLVRFQYLLWCHNSPALFLKFRYSEKATKNDKFPKIIGPHT